MICINKGWYVKIIRPEMEDREILPGIHPLNKKALQEWCDEYNAAEHRQYDGRKAIVVSY
jgi:hypothetical protein